VVVGLGGKVLGKRDDWLLILLEIGEIVSDGQVAKN